MLCIILPLIYSKDEQEKLAFDFLTHRVTVEMFLNQDYRKLRQQCLAQKKLFEDPFFEPSENILRRSDKYSWLRPKEIVKNPEFEVEGFSRFDVTQGAIGNCWFLAAVASLTQEPRIFANVVCNDNSFGEKYAGIFHFRFWLYGNWVDVVVDDRLPTYRSNKELVFMHSSEKNEFWPALLEKAYAKFYGSYELLRGGNTVEALEDFTGGVGETFHSKSLPTNFFNILEKSFGKHALIGCSIDASEDEFKAVTSQGLVKGHAYSITNIQSMEIRMPKKSGLMQMVRLRNPWGNEVEWNGAFSDKSREWQFIPELEKHSIGLTFANDGEFWMTYRDFLLNFDSIEICNLLKIFRVGASMDEFEEQKNWHLRKGDGEWKIDISAGGCRNFIESFHTNPKFILKLNTPDENDNDGMCSIIVALLQKNRRRLKLSNLSIGFAIYDISEYQDSHSFNMDFFTTNASVARSNSFTNIRGNTQRCKLPPGKYLIIPTTFEPNYEGQFLLRVLSENSFDLEKL